MFDQSIVFDIFFEKVKGDSGWGVFSFEFVIINFYYFLALDIISEGSGLVFLSGMFYGYNYFVIIVREDLGFGIIFFMFQLCDFG